MKRFRRFGKFGRKMRGITDKQLDTALTNHQGTLQALVNDVPALRHGIVMAGRFAMLGIGVGLVALAVAIAGLFL